MTTPRQSELHITFNQWGQPDGIRFAGHEFAADLPPDLFLIQFRGITGVPIQVRHDDFALPQCTREETDAETRFRFDFRECRKFPGIQASVTVRIPFTGAAGFWRIAVAGQRSDFRLEWIDFPRIRLRCALKGQGGNGVCFLPVNEGAVYEDFEIREHSYFKPTVLEYPLSGVSGYYPGPCPMQFMAVYTPDAGLYFACHDAGHAPKGIDIFPEADRILRTSFQHFQGENGTMSYEVAIAGFHGDWRNAAAIYREWMRASDQTLPPKLADNPRIPEWLPESPVLLIYPVRGSGKDCGTLPPNEYFPYCNALPHIENYQQLMDSRIMALLMHWEGTAPWAPPYVWPPFGGEKLLDEFAEKLHAKGNLLGLYCSGTGWTQKSSIDTDYSREEQFERENLSNEMCTGPRREMYSIICNNPPGLGPRLGYEMCPAREFTRKTVSDEIRKISFHAVDYLQYFDQNQGCSAQLCYAATHGHPSVPGQWLTDAMRDLLARAVQTLQEQNSKTILGCENAAAEPYIASLPFNDLRNHIGWRSGGVPVPAYGFLFHEYVNNFIGNGVNLADWIDCERSPEFLCFYLAYAVHCGDVMSVVLKDGGRFHWSWSCDWQAQAPVTGDAVQLIANLNRWRKPEGKAHRYLVYGEMAFPPESACPSWQLHFKFDRAPAVLPGILINAWRYAGKEALFLINFHNFPVDVEFPLPQTDAVLYRTPRDPGIPTTGARQQLKIAPLDARLIEYSY